MSSIESWMDKIPIYIIYRIVYVYISIIKYQLLIEMCMKMSICAKECIFYLFSYSISVTATSN